VAAGLPLTPLNQAPPNNFGGPTTTLSWNTTSGATGSKITICTDDVCSVPAIEVNNATAACNSGACTYNAATLAGPLNTLYWWKVRNVYAGAKDGPETTPLLRFTR
jgi:hypothetical protein